MRKKTAIGSHPLYRRWTHIRCVLVNEKYREDNHMPDDLDCDWDDFWSFANDIESYLGPQPGDEYVLHRKNTRKGWTLKNLEWTTRKEVGRTQRTILPIRYKGKTKCLSEWCEELGLSYWTARRRVERGLKPSEVLRPVK